MPMLSRISSRHSTRANLSVGSSIVVLLSVSAALITWQGSPVAGVLLVLACALIVGVFVLIRRVLRRASAQIDAIFREELGSARVESAEKVR
jgi:drug/metabolite transporter (DMT)-like permease